MEKTYVYHITSSVVSDRDDFVTAVDVHEAVENYITWYKQYQDKDIFPKDILSVQRIGNNLKKIEYEEV